MSKNKELSKDLIALRKHKDILFKRPLVSQKKFLNILSGKDTSFNIDQDLIESLENIETHGQFTDVSLGEFISDKIEDSAFTLQQVASNINLPIEVLFDLLDEQILPWNIPAESLNRLCLLLDISKKVVMSHIKNTNINEKNISSSLSRDYAARSQNGISSSSLEKALYDANLKIAIDREKEKRDKFITLFSK